MKVLAITLLVVCAYVANAERCSSVADCSETQCASTADHAHVQCVLKHCTCSVDKLPLILPIVTAVQEANNLDPDEAPIDSASHPDQNSCLSVSDCQKGRCFDRSGHQTTWHCLDSSCVCLRV